MLEESSNLFEPELFESLEGGGFELLKKNEAKVDAAFLEIRKSLPVYFSRLLIHLYHHCVLFCFLSRRFTSVPSKFEPQQGGNVSDYQNRLKGRVNLWAKQMKKAGIAVIKSKI